MYCLICIPVLAYGYKLLGKDKENDVTDKMSFL